MKAKRIGLLFLSAVFLLMVLVPGLYAGQKVKIGIITILENDDLNLLKDAFLMSMTENGYDVEHLFFNANSQKYPDTFAQRGARAAEKMVAEGVQLIYSTAMYTQVGSAAGNVPVIDPSHFIIPKTAQSFKKEGNKTYCTGNGTGTYLTYPFPEIVRFVKESFPNAKKIAYLYNPKSPISRPINEISTEATKAGLTVVDCPFTGKEEALQALLKAKSDADVAFCTNDIAVVNAHMETIAFTNENKFPIIFSIVPLVKAGALAALQIDWKQAAKMCAQKADMILKGTKANTIPVDKPDQFEIGINLKTAQNIGVDEIPSQWIEEATIKVE